MLLYNCVCGVAGAAGQLRRGGAGAAWAGGRARGSVVPGGRPAGHTGGRRGAAGRGPEGGWTGCLGMWTLVCDQRPPTRESESLSAFVGAGAREGGQEEAGEHGQRADAGGGEIKRGNMTAQQGQI